MPAVRAANRSVAVITLGCARNEVDSEELAGRLGAGGWTVVPDVDAAQVVLVNTCGFIDAAKKDSIDTVLAAADGQRSERRVVAVGCLVERYGAELASALPEADAVLGFDAYPQIAERLDDVVAGRPVDVHRPRDRRTLLPVTPAHRPLHAPEVSLPGHGWLPGARRRLDDAPTAYLKLASGCDRRCSFCAIPSFRGSFISRPPDEVLAEARWLADTGARELVLVSENSTSYGKDLGDVGALERLLPQLAAVDGVARIRVSYLQPAELRPGLLAALATTPGVAAYFDLSFQHASPTVLRRMRRFGSSDSFLELLDRIRRLAPVAGVRSNVIVGFPGETDEELAELHRFLAAARLDAIGVFGYSDEDGTSAARLPGKIPPDEVADRVSGTAALADELVAQRADERRGEQVEVLVEDREDGALVGRAAHQGPDADGTTRLPLREALHAGIGDLVPAVVVASDGSDLIAREPRDAASRWAMTSQPARAGRVDPATLASAPDPAAVPTTAASVWNVANGLTGLRLLLVPLFALALLHDAGDNSAWRVLAWFVFAVASLTDRFDGQLARRRGLVTDFGKLADPIADKALIGTALVGLSALNELPWWVTVVVLARELAITGLRLWVIRHGVIPASRGGKLKTLLQSVAIGLYVLPLSGWLHAVAVIVMAAAVVLTVATGVDYVVRALRLRRVARMSRIAA